MAKSKRDRIELLYAALSRAETRTEVARIIAELKSEGVNITPPRPMNGAAGKKSEEAAKRAAFLMKDVHRLCAAIPYGESSWCYGYIHGVTYDPKDGVCLYTIHLDDGRRIVKRYGSEDLRLMDGHKSYRPVGADRGPSSERTSIPADSESMAFHRSYVGFMVEMDGVPVRIASVVKSRGRVMYRIRRPDGSYGYRYPSIGMKYWKDEGTEAVAARYEARTGSERGLMQRIREERVMMERAERMAAEYTARANTHRENIEKLKDEIAKQYQ